MENRLKEIRIAKGLTIRQISERSQISVSHIVRLEKGECDPTLSTMRKLAWALREPVWKVFGE